MKNLYKRFIKSWSNIFAVVKRDFKHIRVNYAAIIIICGLSLIPSLYAWVNILANWDPYSNTKNLPIAVVNKDMGAVIGGEYLTIGDDIALACEENENIGFEVVSDYEANYKLHQGEYYAIIEIPANFTSSLASYLTDTPHKPEIIYRANEKANAIATKITDVAQTSLTESVKSELVKTVTLKVFEQLNIAAVDIKDNEDEILRFVDVVNESSTTISTIQNELLEENSKIIEIQSILDRNSQTSNSLNNRFNTLADTNQQVRDATTNLDNLNSDLNSKLNAIVDNLTVNHNLINNEIDSLSNNVSDDNIKKINENLNSLIADNNNINSDFTTLIDENIGSLTKDEQDKVKEIETTSSEEVANINKELETLNSNITVDNVQQKIASIQEANNASYDATISRINEYSNVIYPSVTTLNNNIRNSTYSSDTYLNTARIIVPQVDAIVNFENSMGNITMSQLKTINSKLENSKELFNTVGDVTSNVDRAAIDSIVDLMSKDPEKVSQFLSDPINLVTEDVYGDKPFGVSLTPFYTVLGIWVGILLMSALLSVEVYDFEDRKLSVMEKHFGKMIFFLILALIQTSICLWGDIYLLKVEPVDLKLFIELGYLCCLVFTVMIYTLVSLFGNIGKAIAVIIMVFQIAGSGGIYPIQTNPEIFGVIAPIWPFTYAVDAFRQAVSGPDMIVVMSEVKVLVTMMLVFIIFGFIKRYVYKITNFFDGEFKKSGL